VRTHWSFAVAELILSSSTSSSTASPAGAADASRRATAPRGRGATDAMAEVAKEASALPTRKGSCPGTFLPFDRNGCLQERSTYSSMLFADVVIRPSEMSRRAKHPPRDQHPQDPRLTICAIPALATRGVDPTYPRGSIPRWIASAAFIHVDHDGNPHVDAQLDR